MEATRRSNAGRKSKGPRRKVATSLYDELYDLVENCSENWGGMHSVPRGDITAHATALLFGRPDLSPILRTRPDFTIEGPPDPNQDTLPMAS